MILYASFVLVVLVLTMFAKHKAEPEKWDYRSGAVVSLSFSAGAWAQSSTGGSETMPASAAIAILAGFVVAVVLACRFFRYSK